MALGKSSAEFYREKLKIANPQGCLPTMLTPLCDPIPPTFAEEGAACQIQAASSNRFVAAGLLKCIAQEPLFIGRRELFFRSAGCLRKPSPCAPGKAADRPRGSGTV
jgi:hypothetical protein